VVLPSKPHAGARGEQGTPPPVVKRRGRLADETPGTRRVLAEYRQEVWEFTDRLFLWLLLGQTVLAIVTALLRTPQPWDGPLGLPWLAWKALGLGVVITTLPLIAVYSRPGSGSTRREIAVGQGLMTSLLLHVAGGRPEMHYAIFVSLPFLSLYRDVSVLLLASAIAATDHVLACYFWPTSVYGTAAVSTWAWVPDVWWMSIEDLVLALFVIRKQGDMLRDARKQATLDASRMALEREVTERQRTERLLSLQYVITRVLAGANSLNEAAPVILRIMGENQGWHVGELWQVDDSRQFLRCVDIWRADEFANTEYLERRKSLHIAPDADLAGRVWQRHLPLWIPDLAEEPTLPLAILARDTGLHGAFAIPLRNGPEVIGVMSFFSSEVRQANDDHLSMLSALGGQIGQFMERKRMEQGLRDSEERLPFRDRGAGRGHPPGRQRAGTCWRPTPAPNASWRARRSSCSVRRARTPSRRWSTRTSAWSCRSTCRSWSRCGRASRARTASWG
jgi:hypothetical protein